MRLTRGNKSEVFSNKCGVMGGHLILTWKSVMKYCYFKKISYGVNTPYLPRIFSVQYYLMFLKKVVSNFLLVIVFAMMPVAYAADITGVITFKGTSPPEADYGSKMTEASPDCAAMYDPAKMPTTHFYVVGPKGELADEVVSLKNVTGKSAGASTPPVVLDQKGCLYTPTILAVQTGR